MGSHLERVSVVFWEHVRGTSSLIPYEIASVDNTIPRTRTNIGLRPSALVKLGHWVSLRENEFFT